jgi:hypothetical protein
MKFYLPFLLAALCIITSCKDKSKINDSLKDKYVKGTVIIRAEKMHTIGMIKLLDIFNDDQYLESPSRAILYSYDFGAKERDGVNQFDLHDTVLFKLCVKDGLQFAMDIVSYENENQDLMPVKDVYKVMKLMDINLHNSDPHREGPQHRIWHRKPNGIRRATSSGEVFTYSFYDPQNPSSREIFYITESSGNLEFGTNYYLYLSDVLIPDNSLLPSSEEIFLRDDQHVYFASTSHSHTH